MSVKVFKTSIVPAGEQLEPIRTAKYTAGSMTIEIFHILCFLIIFSGIFASIWKAALIIDRKEKSKNRNKKEQKQIENLQIQQI